MELFTWLGKSDRPVATTLAPASFASHGQISGIGLAQAKTIASLAMPFTHSGRITPGPDLDSEIQTSAPSRASVMPPALFSGLVFLAQVPLVGVFLFLFLQVSPTTMEDALAVHDYACSPA